MPTTLQYYSPFSPDEVDKTKVAAGVYDLIGSVSSASYLDIDYDAMSQAVVFTAVWLRAPSKEGWSESITLPEADTTTEIGVLAHESNTDPEDIQFGGFLTVLGRDDKPSITLLDIVQGISLTSDQSQHAFKRQQDITPF